MKKSMRLYLTGSIHSMFFNSHIKDSAEKLGVKGYIRKMQGSRIEIFIEGDSNTLPQMTEICKKDSKYSFIKSIEEREEKFQGFKDFKIIGF